MSKEYDLYLINHVVNVMKGLNWFNEKMPHLFVDDKFKSEVFYNICIKHDESKKNRDEYDAYDEYFYGENKDENTINKFNVAWLKHIHNNPHHWQYWVLINDDPENGEIILDMPDIYIIEMICDWWSFSWSKNNLTEIFDWYDKHKDYMKLSNHTRQKVESILSDMQYELVNYEEQHKEAVKNFHDTWNKTAEEINKNRINENLNEISNLKEQIKKDENLNGEETK